MSNNNFIMNLFENHLIREGKTHKKSLNEIKKQLKEIKDIRNNNYSELNGNESKHSRHVSFETRDDSETETLVNRTSDMDLSDDVFATNYHLSNAKQYFTCVENKESKLECVWDLFKSPDIDSAVIYCNSRENVDLLTQFMANKGMNVKSFTKIKTQNKEKIIEQFLSELKPIQAIIAVKRIANLGNIPLYINFDLPSRKTYVKKIGSDKNDGREYLVINIVEKSDVKSIMNYEKFFGTKINPLPIKSESSL